MHCISQTAPSFQGISISTSFHERANDTVKKYIGIERPVVFVIPKVLKIMEEIDRNSETFKTMAFPIEEYLEDYSIKLLRFSTCEVIFKEILKNYCNSLNQFFLNEGDRWVFKEGEQTEKVSVEGDKLICSCQYLEKTGIPCAHLHKIIRLTRDNVQDYIVERWRVSPGNEEKGTYKIFVKKGRPKLSRKNIM